MNKLNINLLKKQINYRCTYTGIKETDIIYKKLIKSKINKLSYSELLLLSEIFKKMSDSEILLTLTQKIKPIRIYEDLFKKLNV